MSRIVNASHLCLPWGYWQYSSASDDRAQLYIPLPRTPAARAARRASRSLTGWLASIPRNSLGAEIMAACATCRGTIIFGGVTQDGMRFCNRKCATKSAVLRIAASVPHEVVTQQAAAIHSGECPRCKGSGPVDVRTTHRAVSAIAVTYRQSRRFIACRGCGVRSQLLDTAITLVFGWWGFPWGIIYTPVQISRNIGAMLHRDETMSASPELEQMVRLNLASQAVAKGR